MTPCHPAIMPSCHHTIMPSCRHAIMPSHTEKHQKILEIGSESKGNTSGILEKSEDNPLENTS